MLKDIRLALEIAAEGGVAAPSATLTSDLLARTSEPGFGRSYYPVMIKLIESASIGGVA
jgi:3-hydroxyisobutyrate dehydrogenase-like beta-hydroxyacid dehydrogenase